jgi:hypothetical protein
MHYLIQNVAVDSPSSLEAPAISRASSAPATIRHAVLIAAVVVATTVLSGWVPTRPLYLTNDDVAMRLLVEGHFAPGAEPTPFVMFMHIAIGWLLTALYTSVSGAAWYDLLMLATALAANIALVWTWCGGPSAASRVRALMLSVVMFGPLYATPQFSLIGMSAAAAGLTLLIRACRATGGFNQATAAWRSYGWCLFTVGTLIRAEGAVLLLIQAASGMLITRFSRADSFPRVSGRLLTRATLLASIPLVALVTNFVAYQRSPGWREFPEFNYVRGMLTEYAPAGGVQPELLSALNAKTGWSKNDLQLLQGWFFDNADVFSLEKMRAALTVIRQRDRTAASVLVDITRATRALISETWLPILFVMAISASAARSPRQLLLTAILLIVFLVVAASASAWLKELPFRVYWPMLVLVGGLAIGGRDDDTTHVMSTVSLVAAAILLLFLAIPRWQQQELRAAEARDVRTDVIALSRLDPSLVIIHADALRWEYVWRPFSNSMFPHSFIGIGASVRTPPIQSVLRREGRSDLVNAICSDNRAVLLARAWLPPALVTFMREHYSRRVAFDGVFEGRTFTAWRCHADVPQNALP